jgi:hypothetical protein
MRQFATPRAALEPLNTRFVGSVRGMQWRADMMSPQHLSGYGALLLGVVAVVAGALWAGTLFAVSWLCGRARWRADSREIGALAVELNRRWATRCFVVGAVCALGWVGAAPSGTMEPYRVGGVGAGVLALVLLHGSVAQRAKRIADGSMRAARGEGLRRFALVLSLAMLTGWTALHTGALR